MVTQRPLGLRTSLRSCWAQCKTFFWCPHPMVPLLTMMCGGSMTTNCFGRLQANRTQGQAGGRATQWQCSSCHALGMEDSNLEHQLQSMVPAAGTMLAAPVQNRSRRRAQLVPRLALLGLMHCFVARLSSCCNNMVYQNICDIDLDNRMDCKNMLAFH